MRLFLLFALCACAPQVAIEAHPMPSAGARGAVAVGVIGACDSAGPANSVLEDMESHRLTEAWLSGSLSGSHPREWRSRAAWLRQLGLPALAAPGATEAADITMFQRVHTGGGSTWSSRDLAIDGVLWRVLVLDATATGARHDEQGFWIPKMASQTDYAHLILLMGATPWSLSEGSEASPAVLHARELLRTVERHAGDRLRLIVTGDTGTQEAALPAGPWGPLWVVAGQSGRSAHVPGTSRLLDGGVQLALAPGLADSTGAALSAPGWWEVRIGGASMEVRLHGGAAGADPEERWWIRYTADTGWTRAVE